MARKTKIIIEQGVKIGGKYPAIGTEVSIDAEEANRLISLGAASLPRVKADEGSKPTAKEQLLDKIEKAQSQKELEALVKGHEKDDDIVAAASARLEVILDSEGTE